MEHADFLDLWQIVRVIEDHSTGSRNRFAGTAEIVQGHGAWVYTERGVLTLEGGRQMQAERGYLWQPGPKGFAICFQDGRAFHDMVFAAPGSGQASEAAHWCDPDQYNVTYQFAEWPKWQAEWRVRGPRKDYAMTSVYTR